MEHPDWHQLERLALGEVEATLAALPSPLRDRAQTLPVTLDLRPNPAHCRDGIEPDSLGLFVGPEFAEEGICGPPLPPQIFLFIENLWALAEGNEEVFREEVGLTYMHELGHYLGLDEEDLFERGLE